MLATPYKYTQQGLKKAPTNGSQETQGGGRTKAELNFSFLERETGGNQSPPSDLGF